jgi:hypothetical protein
MKEENLMDKLLNILLYPDKLFNKLTNKRLTLYFGIVLVGIIDLFSPDFIKAYNIFYTGKPAGDIQFNTILSMVLVLLLGIIDIGFFSVVLYDIFKFFKKKEGLPHEASLVKVMKVYIMSHFLIIPVTVLLYYTVFSHVGTGSSQFMINLTLIYFFVILIWSSAIVARGINVLFNFNPILRKLTFIIVFTWNFLLGMVFDTQILSWLIKLFK